MSPQDRHDETFVGRAEELSFLTKLTSGRLPSVTFISGIGGMGKSRLLEAFASQRRARGATAVLIDCSFVEPTERGFIQELGRAVGGEFTTCAEASSRLAGLGDVVEPEECAAQTLAAMREGRFLVLPHPQVGRSFRRKAEDYDSWLAQTAARLRPVT